MSFSDTTYDEFVALVDWSIVGEWASDQEIHNDKLKQDLKEIFEGTKEDAYKRLNCIAHNISVPIADWINYTVNAFHELLALATTKTLEREDFENVREGMPIVDDISFTGNEIDSTFWVIYARYRDIDPKLVARWFTLTANNAVYGYGVAEFDCCF